MRAEQFLYVNYVLQYVNGHAADIVPSGIIVPMREKLSVSDLVISVKVSR